MAVELPPPPIPLLLDDELVFLLILDADDRPRMLRRLSVDRLVDRSPLAFRPFSILSFPRSSIGVSSVWVTGTAPKYL